MQTLSARDAKYNFGRLIDTARAEPVTVEKHGRAVVHPAVRTECVLGHAGAGPVWALSLNRIVQDARLNSPTNSM
jgi:hypothetical protein